ncbi:MAG: hypothetical protein V7K64_21075 [Nostoc sp.]|uniref:hypothetical protein n=1 Tax=Nostoc sp. TaxID=1180 RepID=UPI002FF77D31
MLTTAMTSLEYQHFLRVFIAILIFVIAQLTGLEAVVIQFGAIVILTNLLPDYG